MWKYIGIKECNQFLLSLNLIDCKDKEKYIKTIYFISNNIEKNVMGNIELYMNQTKL